MSEKKTILLTGSGGFVGKNLLAFLAPFYDILAPRSYELDLTDAAKVGDYFAAHHIDFIIHCGSVGGARGAADPADTVPKNLAMVENILAAKDKGVRVILFGSGAGYDKSRALHKVKESQLGEVVPPDLYGRSKLEIARLVKGRYEDDVLMLNIFACYGKGEKESRFPSYAIGQALRGEPITIRQNVVFDYLYIDDLCRIVKFFVENKPRQRVINATPTESISLVKIAEIVREISGISLEIAVLNQELGNEYTGDNTLLVSEMGGFDFTSYKDGLGKFYKIMSAGK